MVCFAAPAVQGGFGGPTVGQPVQVMWAPMQGVGSEFSGGLSYDYDVSALPFDGLDMSTWAPPPLSMDSCGWQGDCQLPYNPNMASWHVDVPWATYDQTIIPFSGHAPIRDVFEVPPVQQPLIEQHSVTFEKAPAQDNIEPPNQKSFGGTWMVDAGGFEAAKTDRVTSWADELEKLEAEQMEEEEHNPTLNAVTVIVPDAGDTSALRHRRKGQRSGIDEPAGLPDAQWPRSNWEGTTEAEEAPNTDKETARVRQLADRLLKKLHNSRNPGNAGARDRRSAAAELRQLAFSDQVSSRAAQLVLQEASKADAEVLASGMHGYVRKGMQSLYANYVIQKIVEILPSSFIAEELIGVGAEAARHRFGCRIICRLLEHGHSSDKSTAKLYAEILTEAEDLCDHTFGSYVVGHFLEFGRPEHRRRVASALRADLVGNAESKRGSRVVEAALQLCSPEDRKILASELLGSTERLRGLAEGQFGCHVVKALLRMPGEHRRRTISLLRPSESKLRASRYGKFVVQTMDSI